MHTQSQSSESPSRIGRDRRREDRRDVDLLVNRFLNGYPYLCRATDISRTGMRVVPLNQPADVGVVLNGQDAPPGTRLQIRAIVQHCSMTTALIV